MTGFKEINLSILIDVIGEEKAKAFLADYSCPRNEDIGRQGTVLCLLVFSHCTRLRSQEKKRAS